MHGFLYCVCVVDISQKYLTRKGCSTACASATSIHFHYLSPLPDFYRTPSGNGWCHWLHPFEWLSNLMCTTIASFPMEVRAGLRCAVATITLASKFASLCVLSHSFSNTTQFQTKGSLTLFTLGYNNNESQNRNILKNFEMHGLLPTFTFSSLLSLELYHTQQQW